MADADFVLASASPRRVELLHGLGLRFLARPQHIDESLLPGETPRNYVARLALSKARAGQADSALPVLGADTIVVVDDEILGKPHDATDAERMLAKLSGRWHQVMTAVAVLDETRQGEALSVSEVCFRATSKAERSAYWASGEPADKAGGYAIQGIAGMFISELRGSYSGVVGLPVFETVSLLQQFGIRPLG